MKFYYNKDLEIKYLVQIYNWNIQDQYYFHYFKDAKQIFTQLKNGKYSKNTTISLYDIKKDIRKDYIKF